jgi:hypothetical protein
MPQNGGMASGHSQLQSSVGAGGVSARGIAANAGILVTQVQLKSRLTISWVRCVKPVTLWLRIANWLSRRVQGTKLRRCQKIRAEVVNDDHGKLRSWESLQPTLTGAERKQKQIKMCASFSSNQIHFQPMTTQ